MLNLIFLNQKVALKLIECFQNGNIKSWEGNTAKFIDIKYQ